MKNWKNWLVMAGLICMISSKAHSQKITVEKVLVLKDFPSGSSLEYYNNKLYLIGDDATQILILDPDYNRVDSVPLFKSDDPRIEKDKKIDLESSTIVSYKNEPHFLLLGSASTAKREKLLLFPARHTTDQKVQTVDTKKFNKRILAAGIKEINYEGMATVKQTLVISNRGNLKHPTNHLVFTSTNFWTDQKDAAIHIAPLKFRKLKTFAGVSGLAYTTSDVLMFTASTEETTSSYDDGKIGNSYLGWVKDISKKTSDKEIKADGFVDLTTANPAFKSQKIESVCVQSINKKVITLHLVADNDNGETTLFKVRMTIP